MKSLSLLLFLTLASMVRAQQLTPAVSSLVAAEKAFAALSAKEGMKKAFLTYLADDAIVFHPGPVNGREHWMKAKESPARLEWRPTLAFVAESGELGYTSGPWIYTPSPDLDQPPRYGYFVSVWKKQKNGKWKVVLDLGATTGFVHADTSLVVPPASASRGRLTMSAERLRVLEAEKKLSALSTSAGLAAAFDKFLAEDARVYRDGMPPLIGRADILGFASGGSMELATTVTSCTLSNARDMAYTYGKYTLQRKDATESGYFFRIWRKLGEWKLVNEVLSAAPKS